MLKLIRMEWKTNRIGKYIRNAVILTASLLAFSMLVGAELDRDVPPIYGKSMLIAGVDLFTHMGYIIFTGVMLAVFITGAYENRTINLLFSYPIKRRKILAAKLLAVWIFNYAALVLSKLAIYAGLFLTSPYTGISVGDIRLGEASFYLNILISSAVMVSISFVALLIGTWMHSSKSVIVASVILTFFTQGNIGEFTLIGSIPFYIVLMLLSIAAVVLLLADVEKRDVM
ncbi:MAG: ABC transporter permease [Lachnospiraceae bacterium]|nr:ABC transporter permease [Lachnospiraceae bacterium]